MSRMEVNKAISLALLTIAASVLSTGVDAEGVPSSEAKLGLVTKNELLADYAQPIIPLDEVINAASSMEGDFPVLTYGTRPRYVSAFFWMDNHRIILNDIEKSDNDDRARVIKIWDVDSNKTIRYGQGSVGCYADGVILRTIYEAGASPAIPGIDLRGALGNEVKEKVIGKKPRVYGNKFECGEPQSNFVTQYADDHLAEMIVPLREEHGFLVTAKRTMLPDGRTDKILENDEIVFHAPDKVPVHIKMNPWLEQDSAPWRPVAFAAYYPFVRAYTFQNRAQGAKDISTGMLSRLANSAFIFAVDSNEIRKVKVPDVFLNGYGAIGPYLSRRGLVWLGGSVLPNQGKGIYLSRGEQVKKIASENSHDGIVSPDGCRLAYTTTRVDLFGKITAPTLKVINLCKGEK